MQKSNVKSGKTTVGVAAHSAPQIEIKKQKGITLIALIITIIVMLILVGVTINVALNGGLFAKAEKATYQTEASTVKEQLEIAKAVEIANNGGNALDDYSKITVEKLDGLDANTKNEYGDKILVNKAGNVCYNPETVTDEEERNWLEEIGINKYSNTEDNWKKRGLSSDNVIYNTLYISEDESVWFVIKSDGSFESSWAGIFTNDTIEEAYQNGILVIENGNTIFTSDLDGTGGAFVFKEGNELFVYHGEWNASDLRGSIIKEENLLGVAFNNGK